ncbi:MAG: tetratricopeptide repeat protein [Candidatus Lokiarchaeota archaeon]|nr:tetratricopeptide repeat protein [Candidatus Lokiarchaeota archaeon]
MSHAELNQLTKAENLFDICKIEEALELLNNQSLFEGLDLQQKSYYQFLKGLILLYQHNIEEAIKLGEQMLREGQKHNDHVYSFDGLFVIIDGLIRTYKFDEAKKKIEDAEDILKLISNKPKSILILREVRLDLLRAAMNFGLGNSDIAEKYVEKLFEFQKELGNKCEFARANQIMAEIMMWRKSRFDLALECGKKILSIAKEIKFNHYWIAVGNAVAAISYHCIGELENSLKHYMKVLEIIKKFKSNLHIASTLNNIGNLHAELGDYEMALQYLEESLKYWERDPLEIEMVIDSIIALALKKGDIILAQKYFQRLENMYNQTPNSQIEIIYKYNKALMMKNSSRIRDKAKAEKLFKLILKTETIIPDIKINSYIHLCDIFFVEYRLNKNDEVLEEINQNITQLLTIAEKSRSFKVFCEIFILQAKLALLTYNVKAARRFLTQAQKIAELYGLKRLAMKISNEHDNLLKEMDKWEILSDSKASLAERIELARLDDQLKTMLKKRSVEIPDISKEKPVMLLILTEGGNLLFSKKFMEDFSFEDDILGGILTTINYIINEVFSEGLDRAIFGQYTLLMMSAQPFLACYIFKGHSYYAYSKIKNFLDSIQNDNFIWQSLQNFFQKSKSVQLNDIPSLESMVMEIFVEKKN